MSCKHMRISYTDNTEGTQNSALATGKSYMDKQKMKEMKQKILFTDYIVKPPKKNYTT